MSILPYVIGFIWGASISSIVHSWIFRRQLKKNSREWRRLAYDAINTAMKAREIWNVNHEKMDQ